MGEGTGFNAYPLMSSAQPYIRTGVTVRNVGKKYPLGITQEHGALEGRGAGIGLANVHARLQSTFGPEYGLEVESTPGEGTVVRMLVPKFRAGVRAA